MMKWISLVAVVYAALVICLPERAAFAVWMVGGVIIVAWMLYAHIREYRWIRVCHHCGKEGCTTIHK